MTTPESPAERTRRTGDLRRGATILGRLRDFYAAQFHLLRRWSGGRPAIVRRGVETLVVSAVALGATVWAIPGIRVRDAASVLVAALVLGALSTLLRPLLIGLLSGLSVILVGLATMLVQTLGFLLLSRLPGGLEIDSVRSALVGSVVYSLVDTMLAAGLSMADDNSFFGTLVRQLVARFGFGPGRLERGVVLIQIDGLAYPLLRRELDAGRLPTLSRWMRNGMTLDEWEPLLPSQTSASQAGILHGTNDGIPAFRWWEKDGQRLLVSNHPADAREIQRRLSDGRGLLANGGASVGNLLSGDATRSFLTAATIDDAGRELRRSHVLDWWFVSPYSYLRWVVLSVGEVVKEIVQADRARRAGLEPQGSRGFPYPLARAATNVLLRHLTAALVIEEMYRGAPVIYADFVDYDEIAHHSGIDRVEGGDAIRGLDRILGMLEKAAVDAPRTYRFVVLSDHGQSPGATFRERYGQKLEEIVDELADEATVHGATGGAEQWERLTALGSEASGVSSLSARLTHAPLRAAAGGTTDPRALPDVVVAASGNLAQISFPHLPGRATKETIDQAYPRLIAGLVRHPGIGLVMARSDADGAVVLGHDGAHHLDDGRVVGVDPVARYGPHAAAGLTRVAAMSNCGDLVIISQFDPISGEVASFEEQIGSHGGLGGWQTKAFVLHPTEWEIDGPIVGAPALHRQLRSWLSRELH